MSKFLDFISLVWKEFESVIEMFIYLGIAYAMHLLFGITYMQAITIVFVYFVLSLLRIVIEAVRNRINR